MAKKIGTLLDNDVFDGEDGPFIMLEGQRIYLDNTQISRMTPIESSNGPLSKRSIDPVSTKPIDPEMSFEKIFSGAEPNLKSKTPWYEIARQGRINRQSHRSLNRGEDFVDQRTIPNSQLQARDSVKTPLSRKHVTDSHGNPALDSKGKPNVFYGVDLEPKQRQISVGQLLGKGG